MEMPRVEETPSRKYEEVAHRGEASHRYGKESSMSSDRSDKDLHLWEMRTITKAKVRV